MNLKSFFFKVAHIICCFMLRVIWVNNDVADGMRESLDRDKKI